MPRPFDPQPVAHAEENTEHRSAARAAAAAFGAHAAALAIGFSANVTPAGATWFGVRGPQCPLGACLGPLACPGCGLLRGTAAALQGDVAFAFAAHPAAPVVAALLLGGALLHLDVLRRRREMHWHLAARRLGHRVLAAAVLLGWATRPFLS